MKRDCTVLKHQLKDGDKDGMHLGVLERHLIQFTVMFAVDDCALAKGGDRRAVCNLVLNTLLLPRALLDWVFELLCFFCRSAKNRFPLHETIAFGTESTTHARTLCCKVRSSNAFKKPQILNRQ